MGCGGNSTARPRVEAPKALTLHGNILDNQSRAIMTICRYCSVTYALVPVDSSKPQSMEEYKKKNPSGHLPMLEHRDFQVYGGNHLIFVYLAKAEPTIGNTLLNTGNDPELEHNIKAAIGWYLAKVMNPCQQFSKLKLDPTSSANAKADE